MKKMIRFQAALLCFLLLMGTIGEAEGVEAKAKVRLNKSKVSLYVGKTCKLKVKGTKKKVTWKSSKKKVASVSKKGVVTAKKKGTAKITAKAGKKKLTCKVTVRKKAVSTPSPEWTPHSQATQSPTAVPTSGVQGTSSPAPSTQPAGPTAPAPDKMKVTFSRESGSYEEPFDLSLTAPEGCTIYYTIDGSIPLSNEERASTGVIFPAKLETQTYTGSIEVKNRDEEENLLWTYANRNLMYSPYESWDGLTGASDPNDKIPKATVIRAMAVAADGTKSDVTTKVYFVGKDLANLYKGASVISVVTDPDNLMSEETGIYRYGNWENSGSEWERPAYVTYIEEDGSIPFETMMGLRMHGGYSRRWGQKSLRLYFRDDWGGLKTLKDYPLIPGATNFDKTEATEKYKRFILRNGGNDYKYTKMADVWIQSLVTDRAYTTQSSRPTVLYLNGEYWGLYNLTERYSDSYLETEFGVDKDNVISFKEGEWQEGQDEKADTAKYNELMALADLDMTQTENYEKFKEMVDLQSFLDYYATEAYIGNKDWPAENGVVNEKGTVKNIQIWRANEIVADNPYADGKWRYMLYDTEYSMDLWGCDSQVGNAIEWARQDVLFNAVSENKEFQKAFAATVVDLADNNFDPDKAEEKWDELEAVFRPLMEQYFQRWGTNAGGFDSGPDRIQYLRNRKSKMLNYLKDSFGDDILTGIE